MRIEILENYNVGSIKLKNVLVFTNNITIKYTTKNNKKYIRAIINIPYPLLSFLKIESNICFKQLNVNSFMMDNKDFDYNKSVYTHSKNSKCITLSKSNYEKICKKRIAKYILAINNNGYNLFLQIE